MPRSRLLGGDEPGMVGDEADDDEPDDDDDELDDEPDDEPGGDGWRGNVWKLDRLLGFQPSSLCEGNNSDQRVPFPLSFLTSTMAFQASDCCGWWCCTITTGIRRPAGGALLFRRRRSGFPSSRHRKRIGKRERAPGKRERKSR